MQESVYGQFVRYKDYFKLENDYDELSCRYESLLEAAIEVGEVLRGMELRGKIAFDSDLEIVNKFRAVLNGESDSEAAG